MTSRRNCIRTSLITHLLLQCAAVTTKSSLMRNPPHVWPPLFCTEAIYCIEFSGTFSPCMMSLPRTAKISKSQNQVNVLFNSSWMTTRFGFLTDLDACQKMEKQKCTQTVHDGSESNLWEETVSQTNTQCLLIVLTLLRIWIVLTFRSMML